MATLAITLFVFCFVYFLPFLIGNHRGMRAQGALFACNLLFGWTVLGWLFCFLWSILGQTQQAYFREMAEIMKAKGVNNK